MMKKVMVPMLGLIIALAAQGAGFAAVVVGGHAPTVSNPAYQSDVDTTFENLRADAQNNLNKYGSQRDLVRGFANSGVYASQVGSLFGYQGYDIFAVSVSSLAGGQSPAINPGDVKNSFDDLKDRGDIYAGAAWQVWALTVGINCSEYILDDLYLGLKFGYSDFSVSDFNFNTMVAGLLVNYQLVKAEDMAAGSLLWRGVSVGSGLIYEMNNTTYALGLDTISETSATAGGNVTVNVDQSIRIGAENFAVVMPLEVSTAIRLLYVLNLSLGLGVDLNAGDSRIKLKSGGDVFLTNPANADLQQTENGYLSVDGGTKGNGAYFARPRVMAGIGIGGGPVMIDIPVTWYLTKGFSTGLSVTFAW